MISKNSSGSNLNANYGSIIQGDSRSFQAKILLNGSELSCDMVRLEIKKGSCGTGGGFQVGSLIANTLTAQVKNLETGIKGEDIEVCIGLKIGDDYEWITLGTFTVADAETDQYVTNFIGYGQLLSKTGAAFVAPQSLSIGNIISSIRTTTGLTITVDPSIEQTKVLTKSLTGYSCYQVLQIIAACCGGYVTDTYDGGIAIHTYSDTPTLAVGPELMTTPPNIEEGSFEINGVLCKVREATDEQRTVSGSINLSGTGTVNIQSLTWVMSPLAAGEHFTVSGIYTVNGTATEYSEEFIYGTASDVILSSDEDEETGRSYALHLIYNGSYGILLQLNSVRIAYSVSADMTSMVYTEHIPAIQYPTAPTGNENVVTTNEYMTADIYISIMAPNLNGYEYYPANIELALGDPRIEGSDVLEVTDVKGNEWTVPCHEVTHIYDGGFSTHVTATKATAADDSLAETLPIAAKLNQINLNLQNAQGAADRANNSAESAKVSAGTAKAAAESAVADAATAKAAADEASASATEAKTRAYNANQAANGALAGLEIVQDVAGTLEWIKEHGSYEVSADVTIDPDKVYFTLQDGDYVPIALPEYAYVLSEDTEVVSGKTYYSRTGSGTSVDPYVYTEIENPTGDPSASGYYERQGPNDQGWYELSIRDSQSDFIMAHLAVTARGLWVLPNGKADEYQESTDTEVVAGKHYYERTGSGTAADPYVYTEVVPVGTEDPSEEGWYEELSEEERTLHGIGYKALLTNTGLEVYDDNGILVSNFGESIEFSSTRNQRIGGPNAFIEYDNASGTLTISGSKVYFSQLDDRVNGLRGDINTELTIVEGDIKTLQERAEIVDNAVIIDPDEPSVTVVSSPSQVKIKSDAIELKGGANATTFITPNGMETTSLTAREMHPRVNVQGQAIGPFSFIARENGHFSLKKIRS